VQGSCDQDWLQRLYLRGNSSSSMTKTPTRRIAADEQGTTSFLDRAGFGALFISAMLTISVIGSIYICFLAR
jgi:hypothetical protein